MRKLKPTEPSGLLFSWGGSQNSAKHCIYKYSLILKDTNQNQPNEETYKTRVGRVSDTELCPFPVESGHFSLPTARPCAHQTGSSTGLQHPGFLLTANYIDVVDWIIGRVIEFNPSQCPLPRGWAGSEPQLSGERFGLSMTSLHPELSHLLA